MVSSAEKLVMCEINLPDLQLKSTQGPEMFNINSGKTMLKQYY